MRRKNRNHYETMFSLFQFTSGTSLIQSGPSRNVSAMYCLALILAILVRIRNGSHAGAFGRAPDDVWNIDSLLKHF